MQTCKEIQRTPWHSRNFLHWNAQQQQVPNTKVAPKHLSNRTKRHKKRPWFHTIRSLSSLKLLHFLIFGFHVFKNDACTQWRASYQFKWSFSSWERMPWGQWIAKLPPPFCISLRSVNFILVMMFCPFFWMQSYANKRGERIFFINLHASKFPWLDWVCVRSSFLCEAFAKNVVQLKCSHCHSVKPMPGRFICAAKSHQSFRKCRAHLHHAREKLHVSSNRTWNRCLPRSCNANAINSIVASLLILSSKPLQANSLKLSCFIQRHARRVSSTEDCFTAVHHFKLSKVEL